MMSNPPAKQLIILSGKGGTGKTSITASFAHLAKESQNAIPSVLVDADVDAANLGLVLQPNGAEQHEFWGGSLAKIDPIDCIGCGRCADVCRYDAALPTTEDPGIYMIDPLACDGCAACVYACPQEIITMIPQQEGLWFHSQSRYGEVLHAELFPGGENSGKLVTTIKQQARLVAEDNGIPLLIIDGPPGIGCPVISACAGTDLALIVTEPSKAGIHDLKRIHETLQHFRVPSLICINKMDIYPDGVQEIHNYAAEHDAQVIAEIPFDANIPNAMVQAQPVTAFAPDSPASLAINELWTDIAQRIKTAKGES
jgi:MinD superfamily P-loop ATPase